MGKVYIAGRNQTKTVTPSNTTQTVTPDNGYNALDAVVVEPIAALMPQSVEEYVKRTTQGVFSLNLNGVVPAYACYGQSFLKAVYGDPVSIGDCAFQSCTGLEEIDLKNTTSLGANAFYDCTSIENIRAPKITTLSVQTFLGAQNLKTIDLRGLSYGAPAVFRGCINILAIDIRNVQAIANENFNSATRCKLIDITNSHAATLGSVNSLPANIDLTILVADATDKAYYQSATNWSAHASQIKTVAEFEQEIGKSYDVYYEEVFGHPRFDTQQGA